MATLNVKAMDRPGFSYAASIMLSHASSPTYADMIKIKRVGRFLHGRATTWTHYRWEVRPHHILAHTDSDWAAHREDRPSMSGGMLVRNSGLLRFWSRRQKEVSLSSWESELHASVSTGVAGLGLHRRCLVVFRADRDRRLVQLWRDVVTLLIEPNAEDCHVS